MKMFNKGIVLDISGDKVSILTKDGEFLYVSKNLVIPEIGEEYEGLLYKNNFVDIFKFRPQKFITAASILLIFSSLVVYNVFFSVYETYEIKINPDIKLYTNRIGHVIKTEYLNKDGSILLSKLSLKNKDIESALEDIVITAKDLNYLNKNNSNVSITSSKGIEKTFPKVEETVATYKEEFKHSQNIKDNIENAKNNNVPASLKENENQDKESTDSLKDDIKDNNSNSHKDRTITNESIENSNNNNNSDSNKNDYKFNEKKDTNSKPDNSNTHKNNNLTNDKDKDSDNNSCSSLNYNNKKDKHKNKE